MSGESLSGLTHDTLKALPTPLIPLSVSSGEDDADAVLSLLDISSSIETQSSQDVAMHACPSHALDGTACNGFSTIVPPPNDDRHSGDASLPEVHLDSTSSLLAHVCCAHSNTPPPVSDPTCTTEDRPADQLLSTHAGDRAVQEVLQADDMKSTLNISDSLAAKELVPADRAEDRTSADSCQKETHDNLRTPQIPANVSIVPTNNAISEGATTGPIEDGISTESQRRAALSEVLASGDKKIAGTVSDAAASLATANPCRAFLVENNAFSEDCSAWPSEGSSSFDSLDPQTTFSNLAPDADLLPNSPVLLNEVKTPIIEESLENPNMTPMLPSIIVTGMSSSPDLAAEDASQGGLPLTILKSAIPVNPSEESIALDASECPSTVSLTSGFVDNASVCPAYPTSALEQSDTLSPSDDITALSVTLADRAIDETRLTENNLLPVPTDTVVSADKVLQTLNIHAATSNKLDIPIDQPTETNVPSGLCSVFPASRASPASSNVLPTISMFALSGGAPTVLEDLSEESIDAFFATELPEDPESERIKTGRDNLRDLQVGSDVAAPHSGLAQHEDIPVITCCSSHIDEVAVCEPTISPGLPPSSQMSAIAMDDSSPTEFHTEAETENVYTSDVPPYRHNDQIITEEAWPSSSPVGSSQPRASSPDRIFISSPPLSAYDSPPSSQTWRIDDKTTGPDESLTTTLMGDTKDDGPSGTPLGKRKASNDFLHPDDAEGKRAKLTQTYVLPPPPNPKRPTQASQKRQYKKLVKPFRSPIVNVEDVLTGKDGVYASGHAAATLARDSINAKDQDLQVLPTIRTELVGSSESPMKDHTPNAAKPFRLPFPAAVLTTSGPTDFARTQLKTPVKATKSSSVQTASTIQALQARVQKLKQAIKIKEERLAAGDAQNLETLVTKWRTVGREVAWLLWDTVKDLEPGAAGMGAGVEPAKGGWDDGENPFALSSAGAKKVGKSQFEGWGFGSGWGYDDKKDGPSGNWGWDESGKDAKEEGNADEAMAVDEGEQPAQTHSVGTMLRYMGIDPDTLGWDEDEGDFVGEA